MPYCKISRNSNRGRVSVNVQRFSNRFVCYDRTKGGKYRSGIGLGMLSTAIPVIAVVVGIIASFLLASGFDFSNVGMGLYGIGIAAVGMLTALGITMATDA